MTPAAYDKAESSLDTWRPTAEMMKLNEAVDQQIGTGDSTFRSYLEEYKKSERREGNHVRSNMIFEHRNYLDQKRDEFWRSQDSRVDVYLSDPSLAKTCGLPDRSQ